MTIVEKIILKQRFCTRSISLESLLVNPGCHTGHAGLPAVQLDRLQSVLNAAARLIYRRRKFDHVSPLLKELHWLPVPERNVNVNVKHNY